MARERHTWTGRETWGLVPLPHRAPKALVKATPGLKCEVLISLQGRGQPQNQGGGRHGRCEYGQWAILRVNELMPGQHSTRDQG